MLMQVIRHIEFTEMPRAVPGNRSRNRALILDVVNRLLRRRSLDGITMDEVAREAGLTRRTIYNYFASTGDLFAFSRRALLAEITPLVPSVVAAELPMQPALTRFAFQALRLFGDWRHIDLYLSVTREGHGCPWLTQGYDTMIQTPMIAALSRHLADARHAGQFEGDPRGAAFQLLWTLQAASASALLLSESHADRATLSCVEAIVSAFLIQHRPATAAALAA